VKHALVENETLARTDDYALVALASPAMPGSIIDVRITGHEDERLTGTLV
jgi:tRNA A37 methylthiotransferase MiaB